MSDLENNLWEAVTFAEVGEWETAISIMTNKKISWGEWFESTMITIAMAEEGVVENKLPDETVVNLLESFGINKKYIRPFSLPIYAT